MSKKKDKTPKVVNKKESYYPSMLKTYRDLVVPNMVSRFNYENSMQVPRLLSIALNMGLGDAKLLSVIGVWFGWKIIPFTIFFASVIGLIYAAPIIIKKKSLDFIISFGPFLILGLICSLMINIVYKLF